MNRGEVWWVDFEPSVGGEAGKVRPAAILSSDVSNRHLNRLQVVPLTSNMARVYAGEASVTVNGSARKARANMLTTVSKERVSSRLAVLSPQDVQRIEEAIRLQLGL